MTSADRQAPSAGNPAGPIFSDKIKGKDRLLEPISPVSGLLHGGELPSSQIFLAKTLPLMLIAIAMQTAANAADNR